MLVLGVLGEPSNILVSTCMTQEPEEAQVKADLLVPVSLMAGGQTYAGALVVLRKVDLQTLHWMSIACWFYNTK